MVLKVACRASDIDKHSSDVHAMLFHKGKLYTASDDGTVKLWSEDLVKQAEVKAHARSVYSIAASDDTLYTCSNDGSIKMFELNNLAKKGTLTEQKDGEFYKVLYKDGHLFAGHNEGNVKVNKDNNLFEGNVDLAENVRDMVVTGDTLITAKNNDVIAVDMKFNEGPKVQYDCKAEFVGRAPVTLVGDKLFAYVNKEGKDIILQELNAEDKYRKIYRIEDVSQLLINALAGTVWNDETLLFSAGWDKKVRKWLIRNNAPSDEGSVDVDIVVNSLAIGTSDSLYAAGGDGHIVRVDQS